MAHTIFPPESKDFYKIEDLPKEIKEWWEIMPFDYFVSCYLPDGAKEYLRESLKNGRGVHFYGAQGTGKSTLCDQFRRNGFKQVTEPGMDSQYTYPPNDNDFVPPLHLADPFCLPKVIRNVSLIELCGIRKPLPEWKRFTREEIEAWIKA